MDPGDASDDTEEGELKDDEPMGRSSMLDCDGSAVPAPTASQHTISASCSDVWVRGTSAVWTAGDRTAAGGTAAGATAGGWTAAGGTAAGGTGYPTIWPGHAASAAASESAHGHGEQAAWGSKTVVSSLSNAWPAAAAAPAQHHRATAVASAQHPSVTAAHHQAQHGWTGPRGAAEQTISTSMARGAAVRSDPRGSWQVTPSATPAVAPHRTTASAALSPPAATNAPPAGVPPPGVPWMPSAASAPAHLGVRSPHTRIGPAAAPLDSGRSPAAVAPPGVPWIPHTVTAPAHLGQRNAHTANGSAAASLITDRSPTARHTANLSWRGSEPVPPAGRGDAPPWLVELSTTALERPTPAKLSIKAVECGTPGKLTTKPLASATPGKLSTTPLASATPGKLSTKPLGSASSGQKAALVRLQSIHSPIVANASARRTAGVPLTVAGAVVGPLVSPTVLPSAVRATAGAAGVQQEADALGDGVALWGLGPEADLRTARAVSMDADAGASEENEPSSPALKRTRSGTTKKIVPGEVVPPADVTLLSKYVGVYWRQQRGVWVAKIRDGPLNRLRQLGTFKSEEEAACAYDEAASQSFGDNAVLNFPRGGSPRSCAHARGGSRYYGVNWSKKMQRWYVSIKEGGTRQYLASFRDEEEAARAYDRAVLQLFEREPNAKPRRLNFSANEYHVTSAASPEHQTQTRTTRNVLSASGSGQPGVARRAEAAELDAGTDWEGGWGGAGLCDGAYGGAQDANFGGDTSNDDSGGDGAGQGGAAAKGNKSSGGGGGDQAGGGADGNSNISDDGDCDEECFGGGGSEPWAAMLRLRDRVDSAAGAARLLDVAGGTVRVARLLSAEDIIKRRRQRATATREDAVMAAPRSTAPMRKGPSGHFSSPDKQPTSVLPSAAFKRALVHARQTASAAQKYKGVSKEGSMWYAQLFSRAKGSTRHLGRFDTQEEAARAYDVAVLKSRGVDAVLNFPENIERYMAESGLTDLPVEELPGREGKSSKYRGVCWVHHYQHWQSQIHFDGRQWSVGTFQDEVEAARTYDMAYLRIASWDPHGRSRRMNFPPSDYTMEDIATNPRIERLCEAIAATGRVVEQYARPPRQEVDAAADVEAGPEAPLPGPQLDVGTPMRKEPSVKSGKGSAKSVRMRRLLKLAGTGAAASGTSPAHGEPMLSSVPTPAHGKPTSVGSGPSRTPAERSFSGSGPPSAHGKPPPLGSGPPPALGEPPLSSVPPPAHGEAPSLGSGVNGGQRYKSLLDLYATPSHGQPPPHGH